MRRRYLDFWLGLWTLLFIGASALLAYLHPFAPKTTKPETLTLRAVDHDGRLQIDWDTQHELIRKAQGATLEVDDGGVLNRYPVEPKTLRAGGFDYVRKTQDVLLTLTLFHDGKPGALATVRSVGAVRASAPEPPAQPEPRSSRGRRR